MSGDTILHLQKVAGISGSGAHLLSLPPRLRERGCELEIAGRGPLEPAAVVPSMGDTERAELRYEGALERSA
jgi:hypothetical protein